MKLTLLKATRATALAGIDFELEHREVYKRAVKVAEALPENISKAAIFAENAPEWVFACYGTWHKGATVIPIDAKSSAEEVAFVLDDAYPEVLFVSKDNLEVAKEAIEKSKTQTTMFVLEDFFENAEYKDPELNSTIEREYDELGLIVYTSGTTGNPKGVMLTFENMAANMRAVAEAKYFFDGVRVLAMLPFHHILPLMGTMIMPLSINGKMVFPKTISPADISEVLQKHSVDMVVSVPRFYELVHSNIMAKIQQSKIAKALFTIASIVDNLKFSQILFKAIHKKFGGVVKFWISGGAALDKTAWRELNVLGFRICEGYGMTECAPIISFPRIDKIKLGSPGQPLQGVEIRIVDGEIAVKGANVTKGYFNRPEETAESLRNGWLYTGDLGYVDEDGFLFITGRRKEIIVLANGKNVNPAEIEISLQRQCKDITECGVLMYEGTLRAIVKVEQALIDKLGIDGAKEQIRNNAILPFNRNAPTYKRVIKFSLTTDELPRTRVGKLKRHLLASYIDSEKNISQREAIAEPNTDVYKQLKEVLEKQISLAVDCDAHMEMDLGLDSLGKIAMQCFVQENYGVDVSEKDFETYSSLRTFAEMVDKNKGADNDGLLKNISWADIIKSCKNITLNKPHFFHFATISLFNNLSKLLYKVKYEGVKNLEQSEPVIIAANHQSFVDGALIISKLSKTQVYKTYFFAKIRNILKNSLLKKFAERSNVIIMDINENVKDSICKLAKALKDGNRIVIFPEGTRTKDGDIAEFKTTFAIIAKEMNIPVIPVCISGAFENIKAGKTFPKFGANIKVEYLEKMLPKVEESYAEFSERVRKAIDTALTASRDKMLTNRKSEG